MSGTPAIYLDFAASAPCADRVVTAMLPYFAEEFGNPGNAFHRYGLRARLAVDEARDRAARLIGCLPQEIVWTSGATEANNLAIRGTASSCARARSRGPLHLVTAAHEHKSVLATCWDLERDGWDVSYLQPPPSGVISAAMVEEALRDETKLVSIMAANNEIGTLNEVAAIGELCRRREIPFHCDATQWVGKLPFDARAACVDLLSWSAHKMYGPKGVGALFVRFDAGRRLAPLLTGGGQEGGLRSGTLNVPGIVGLGVACHISGAGMESEAARVDTLRNRLETTLVGAIPGAAINGDPAKRLPNITSVTIPLETDRDLVTELREVACSSGAACSGPDDGPSHVLLSIGVPRTQARNTLRLSLGRPTDTTDVDRAAEDIVDTVRRLSRGSRATGRPAARAR